MYKTELNCNPTRLITTKQEAVSHYGIISKMNTGEHNTYQEKKLESKVRMSFPYCENIYHKIIYMVKPNAELSHFSMLDQTSNKSNTLGNNFHSKNIVKTFYL